MIEKTWNIFKHKQISTRIKKEWIERVYYSTWKSSNIDNQKLFSCSHIFENHVINVKTKRKKKTKQKWIAYHCGNKWHKVFCQVSWKATSNQKRRIHDDRLISCVPFLVFLYNWWCMDEDLNSVWVRKDPRFFFEKQKANNTDVCFVEHNNDLSKISLSSFLTLQLRKNLEIKCHIHRRTMPDAKASRHHLQQFSTFSSYNRELVKFL